MTIAIMLDFPVCFAIAARTTRRNQPCPAKRHMRLAPAVTHSSSQIQPARSALSVTPTFRAERLRPFLRCAVSTSDSITRNTQPQALLAQLVIVVTVAVLGSRFLRD